jgi:hypothetical protein
MYCKPHAYGDERKVRKTGNCPFSECHVDGEKEENRFLSLKKPCAGQ